MGLDPETVKDSDQHRPVADYVVDYVEEHGRVDWARWLQTHRYELNAMTSPQFIEWLTRKMEAQGVLGKVIPDQEFIDKEVRRRRKRLPINVQIEKCFRFAALGSALALGYAPSQRGRSSVKVSKGASWPPGPVTS